MIAAILIAILLFLQPSPPPPVVDPMADRCGYSDPTVEVDIYEACLELFGYSAA